MKRIVTLGLSLAAAGLPFAFASNSRHPDWLGFPVLPDCGGWTARRGGGSHSTSRQRRLEQRFDGSGGVRDCGSALGAGGGGDRNQARARPARRGGVVRGLFRCGCLLPSSRTYRHSCQVNSKSSRSILNAIPGRLAVLEAWSSVSQPGPILVDSLLWTRPHRSPTPDFTA